jgi:hypothetical protein
MFSSTTNSSSGRGGPSRFQWQGAWRTCSFLKEGALSAMKVVTKALYADVLGDVWKMGVFVKASKGIVFLNVPCPQMRVQHLPCFPSLCRLAEDSCHPASCAQCCGDRRHILKSGKYKLFEMRMQWGLPLWSFRSSTKTPCPCISKPPSIPPTQPEQKGCKFLKRRLSFARQQEA